MQFTPRALNAVVTSEVARSTTIVCAALRWAALTSIDYPARMPRPYGTRPDLPDHRDYPWKAGRIDRLPPRVDMRRRFPPVFNQGLLNSCSANALSAAVWF